MTRAFAVRLLSLYLTIAFVSFAQTPGSDNDATAAVTGVWRGNSNCMVKPSPCHDEVNVYRIAKVNGKPNIVSVTADKIVDGKEVVMGTLESKYDPQKHSLDSLDGRFHFTVDGNKMEGALTLPDGTVYRRIHLKREHGQDRVLFLRLFSFVPFVVKGFDFGFGFQ